MARIPSKNTSPEMIVRRALHAMGRRFRLHRNDLPGTPDIILPGSKKAIFVHGCFWHWHGCKIGNPPKSRPEFWLPKLQRNRDRDAEKTAALIAAGWNVLAIWQCETRQPTTLQALLSAFLDEERKAIDIEPGGC
ncbi:very short patch repair endonuclease [Polymorphobacter sp. PAMC 29334]|uniref:very short patch repair endonuclease n=1 Tax=Polymorphobacter sp. PAMC 29334 TaxID=2862331 RepID=UPI0021053DE1|nr:very short patch repair endonuclease [Polymorphobacter sp. PAMC 29334]